MEKEVPSGSYPLDEAGQKIFKEVVGIRRKRSTGKVQEGISDGQSHEGYLSARSRRALNYQKRPPASSSLRESRPKEGRCRIARVIQEEGETETKCKNGESE